MAKVGIFLVKIARSSAFQPGIVAETIRTDIRKYSRKVIDSLEETTENWDNEKPEFYVSRTQVAPSRSKSIELDIGMRGPEKGVKKWRWLDEGTNVRHAMMSDKFRPKTRVGTTKTGAGHPPYDPVWVSKKLLMPGIEAREWTRVVTNRHMKGRGGVQSFGGAMEDAIRRGIDRMNRQTREERF